MHFTYLTLYITPSPRDSVYYETIHTSTCFDKHLSLTPHNILFLALLNLLFSFLRISIYLIFSFCLFMSSPSPPPPQIPSQQLIQLNTISFDSTSFSTSMSFAFSFPFLFFTSSSYTYLRCHGTPAIPPRPQHPRLTLALINSRANQDFYTQLMSSPFLYLQII